MLSNKVYSALKFVSLVFLPALATLVLGLGELYDWSFTSQAVGTITLLDAFLGSMLQLSTKKYNSEDRNFDGFLDAEGRDEDTGIPNLKLVVTKPPEEMLDRKVVRLKVGPAPAQR